MGKAFADPGEGGGRRADIRTILPGCCAGNPTFRLGYMCDDPPHLEGPGRVPPLGLGANNREAPTLFIWLELTVPRFGGSDVGIGIGGDGNVHIQKTEQIGTVYHK